LLLCTTDRAMGPWDQYYIREARPFAAMNYKLINGTKRPRLYLETIEICHTPLPSVRSRPADKILGREAGQIEHHPYQASG
jgi:hypothetical protein